MDSIKWSVNDEHNGIEIAFPSRPDRAIIDEMKEHGFRWHNQKKVWFAKRTPEREAFTARLVGQPDQARETDAAEPPVQAKATGKAKEKKNPNTFAASYDKIGSAAILADSNVSLLSHTEAYFEDIQCHFRRTYGGDCVILTDLSEAGKVGKACQSWRLYPLEYKDDVTLKLLNDERIETCRDLYAALKEGRELEHVKLSPREEKAVEVFSPFQEVKPLKAIPERWNKRNFAIAALSGQIFRGEVAYRYTDDYAMDAAYNFGEGAGINMPVFARDVVEDWGSLTSVRCNDPGKNGVAILSYSEHSNSCKTIWFDVNCDIAEGKRRAEERQAGLERYNKMMESSCIQLSEDQIDPKKIYVLQQLDKDGNTGKYGVKERNVTGSYIQYCIEEGYIHDVLSVSPMDIQPDRIYTVSDFFHRPSGELLSDERVIQCGNYKSIVFGKALMELVAEQVPLHHIAEELHEHGPIFEKAKTALQRFVDGNSRYFVDNATDYKQSMARLQSEYNRAVGRANSLDDIISSAAARAGSKEPGIRDNVIPFQR